MSRQIELINQLYDMTIRMNEALLNKDLGTLEEMIEKRALVIQDYNAIEHFPFDDTMQAKVDELLLVDKENRVLLEAMMIKEKSKLDSMKKEKNSAQKRTSIAKKYATGGYTAMDYSKFNKKT